MGLFGFIASFIAAAVFFVIGLGFALNFTISADEPDARLPSGSDYRRAFIMECVAAFLVLATYPFGWLPRLRPWCFRADGGPVIVLVHGYLLNRASLWLLRWRLAQRGYRNVFTLNLVPMLGSVDTLGRRLSDAVDELRVHSGASPVYAIGHNLGGLVSRYCELADERFTRLLCLGTPHRGSRVVALLPGQNADQMRLGNDLLERLGDSCEARKLVSFASLADNFVVPVNSAAGGVCRGWQSRDVDRWQCL